MAASLSATGTFRAVVLPNSSTLHGDWRGHDRPMLSVSTSVAGRAARPLRSSPRMGNVNEGKGLFAPVVVLARNIIGKKRFNQLRGKAIALHSQVISEFCKSIGANSKVKQGLIRIAKKNGERLGFLA